MGGKTLSAGRGALLLTGIGALSQLLGFGYRVALSRRVGAQVMGLYQLLMPVYSVLLSLTAVGVTAAASNLTSQYLALGNRRGAHQMVRTCLLIFFLLLLPVGAVTVLGSDAISVRLLGDARTQLGLVLLVPCVALTGVENIHKHLFYGAGRVGPPAVVELLEQLVRMGAVLGLLAALPPQWPERAVGTVVAGMVVCEVFSACTLAALYRRGVRRGGLSGPGESGRARIRKICAIALPVGANALLGNLLSAANATLIPRKLVEGGLERSQAIAQFGVVCGMTMPMLSLPIVFLGALNLVLVPRLSRACALERPGEVRRLIGQGLSAVSVLALPAVSVMVVLGPDLGRAMFRQPAVGEYLVPLAVTLAMNCYCSILASALNGIGRQRAVAAISLLGGGAQLLVTLILVPAPGVGMSGFVAGALLSAGLETLLCLAVVVEHTGLPLRLFQWLAAPGLAALLSGLTTHLLFRVLKDSGLSPLQGALAALPFALLVYLAALQAQGVSLRESLRLE